MISTPINGFGMLWRAPAAIVMTGWMLAACQSAGTVATAPTGEPAAAATAPTTAAASEPSHAPETQKTSLTSSTSATGISTEAVDFIIAQEVGSKAAYKGRLGGRPHWDGSGSGVLIGFGYNLGTVSEDQFREDWGDVLSADQVTRLAKAVGVRPSDPDRDAKITQIKELVTSYEDIQIPWDTARQVFATKMLPDYLGRVTKALPNTDGLHPHSLGALVSLVYNRGATFGRGGDRFREMRAIKTHMEAKDFTKVPEEIRSMARLWPNIKHLQRRREGEAALFQKGLDAQAANS